MAGTVLAAPYPTPYGEGEAAMPTTTPRRGDLPALLPEPAVRRLYELAAAGASAATAMESLSHEFELQAEEEIWDSIKRAWPAVKRGAQKAAVIMRIVGLLNGPQADPFIPPPPPPQVVITSGDDRKRRNRRQQELEAEALLSYLGGAAAAAETEGEAQALIGAAVPLAARVVPQAGRAWAKASPGLILNLARTTAALHRDPATRHLIALLPAAARQAAVDVGRSSQGGVRVPPPAVAHRLAAAGTRLLGRQLHEGGEELEERFLGDLIKRVLGRGGEPGGPTPPSSPAAIPRVGPPPAPPAGYRVSGRTRRHVAEEVVAARRERDALLKRLESLRADAKRIESRLKEPGLRWRIESYYRDSLSQTRGSIAAAERRLEELRRQLTRLHADFQTFRPAKGP